MTNPMALPLLVESLGRLAAPPSEQIEYLTTLGVADLVDELALEFDSYYRPCTRQLERTSPDAAVACREIDRMLSSRRLGWYFVDLDSPEWEAIRAVAKVAVAALA